MAGTNKQFTDLREFEITPPSALFAKLWKKIKNTGKEIKKAEPENEKDIIYPETSGIIDLRKLQSYSSPEMGPPPFNFKKIKDTLNREKNEPENAPVKQIKMPHRNARLLAAAAISGIILLTYYLAGNGSLSIKSAHNKSDANVRSLDSANKTNYNTGMNATNTQNRNGHSKNPLEHSNLIYANNFISKNGNSQFYQNDFIYTLTSFTYDESAIFLKKLKKDKLVSLNSYSYLNVSEKIAEFLKAMYEVNDKGKPTKKAKKLKHKLAKWKKKDESYFDRNPQKNPLDIIDLSEFILKK